MDKKSLARLQMLKKLASQKSNESGSSIGEKLKGKAKFSKVEVVADSKKNLEKGLSKAQQILKARLGDAVDETEEPEEQEDGEEVCPECEGEGCKACEESDEDGELDSIG